MGKKIDQRRRYYLVLDTETANTYRDENNRLVSKDALFYDLGAQVVDKCMSGLALSIVIFTMLSAILCRVPITLIK